jgi:hypothetical protein
VSDPRGSDSASGHVKPAAPDPIPANVPTRMHAIAFQETPPSPNAYMYFNLGASEFPVGRLPTRTAVADSYRISTLAALMLTWKVYPRVGADLLSARAVGRRAIHGLVHDGADQRAGDPVHAEELNTVLAPKHLSGRVEPSEAILTPANA